MHKLRTRFPALLALTLSLLPFSAGTEGCAGSQINADGTVSASPDGTWTAGVNIGILVARAALPAIQAEVDADAHLTPDRRTRVDQGFREATDALALARSGLDAYQRTHDATDLCRAHVGLQQGLGVLLQGVPVLQDANVAVPGQLGALLGTLGSFVDLLDPRCAGSAATADAGRPLTARSQGNASQRVLAVLARRSR